MPLRRPLLTRLATALLAAVLAVPALGAETEIVGLLAVAIEPAVAKDLGLSDEQLEKLQTLADAREMKGMTQAMKVAAYGATAAYLAGGFQIVPSLQWIGAVGLYSLYLIFTGLPVLMHVTRRKALTFTVVTLLASIGLSIVVMIGVILSKDTFTPEFPDAAYNYTPPE